MAWPKYKTVYCANLEKEMKSQRLGRKFENQHLSTLLTIIIPLQTNKYIMSHKLFEVDIKTSN